MIVRRSKSIGNAEIHVRGERGIQATDLVFVVLGAAVEMLEVVGSRALVHEHDVEAAVAEVRARRRSLSAEAAATADEERVDGQEAPAHRAPFAAAAITFRGRKQQVSGTKPTGYVTLL